MNTRAIIASGLILALGAGGFVVGATVSAGSFSPPAAPVSEISTVLAPVELLSDERSQVVGTELVPVAPANAAGAEDPDAAPGAPGGSIPGSDPWLEERLASLYSGADPRDIAAELLAAESAAASEPSPILDVGEEITVFGDPCAPAEGDEAADCPDGLRSTVLAYSEVPELWTLGYASPGPRDPALELDFYWCEPASLGDNDVQFGVFSNAPGTGTLTVWPRGDPGSAITVPLTTPDDQRAGWEAGLEAGLSLGGEWLRMRHCVVLEGLDPFIVYDAEYSIVDVLGRTAEGTSQFLLPETRTVPPTYVIPIGNTQVLLTTPLRTNERVVFSSWRIEEGQPSRCEDQADATADVVSATARWFHEQAVSATGLARQGYLPEYTHEASQLFQMPEGSTMILCVKVYDRNAPSFNASTPIWQHETILDTPDLTVPVVSVRNVQLRKGNALPADAVLIAVGQRGGSECGRITLPDGAPIGSFALNERTVLCALDARDPHTAGSFGRIVVRSSVDVDDDDRDPTTQINSINVDHLVCAGVCDLPEASYYRFDLPNLPSVAGEPGPSAGEVLLEVAWSQGNNNGRSDWGIGASLAGAPGAPPRVDLPQLDTDERVTVTGGGSGCPFNARGCESNATYNLVTDRPVTYTATLVGDCSLPTTVRESSGTITGPATARRFSVPLTFSDLCLGSVYSLSIELVDELGRRALWDGSAGSASYLSYWGNNSFATPTTSRQLVTTYEVKSRIPGGVLEPFTVAADSRVIATANRVNSSGFDLRCLNDAGRSGEEVEFVDSVNLGERVKVRVNMRLQSGDPETVDGVSTCRVDTFSPVPSVTATFQAEFSLAELERGVTLSSDPDLPYEVTVQVRAVPVGSFGAP